MKRLIKLKGFQALVLRCIYSLIASKSPLLKDLYNEVIEEITTRISYGRILNVGTGPGYLPLEIAKRTPSLEITGIDISLATVKLANSQR